MNLLNETQTTEQSICSALPCNCKADLSHQKDHFLCRYLEQVPLKENFGIVNR